MALCNTAVTQLLMHWSYCSPALSHQYDDFLFSDDLTDEEALMEQRKRKCSVTATREDILGFLLDVKQSGVVSYNDQDRLSQFSMDSYSDDEEFISQVGTYIYIYINME